jgi:hypothetical protein
MSFIWELPRESHMNEEYISDYSGLESRWKNHLAQERIETTVDKARIWGGDSFGV